MKPRESEYEEENTYRTMMVDKINEIAKKQVTSSRLEGWFTMFIPHRLLVTQTFALWWLCFSGSLSHSNRIYHVEKWCSGMSEIKFQWGSVKIRPYSINNLFDVASITYLLSAHHWDVKIVFLLVSNLLFANMMHFSKRKHSFHALNPTWKFLIREHSDLFSKSTSEEYGWYTTERHVKIISSYTLPINLGAYSTHQLGQEGWYKKDWTT